MQLRYGIFSFEVQLCTFLTELTFEIASLYIFTQNLMNNLVKKHHESTIRNNYYSILNMKGKEYHTSSANLFYFSICLFLHDTKEVRSISEYVGRK